MPYANPDDQRAYQREWIRRRREAWIADNGPCATCGASVDLEVDHIDPVTKSMEPAAIWSLRADRRAAELAKCQVLCRPCHRAKTDDELRSDEHGTHNSYASGCRCAECRTGHATYQRERRRAA